MENILKKEFNAVKKKYPLLEKFQCNFCGSGDSFDSFYDEDVILSTKTDKECDILVECTDKEKSDIIAVIHNTRLLWEILQKWGCGFNDEGCRGVITIDFIDSTVTVDSEYPETVWHSFGEETRKI